MSNPKRCVVLGLGNLLLGDEGFGIHAIHFAQLELGVQFDVEWVDGGVLGLNLLPLVEECSHLLVLDVVDAGLDAGMVIEIGGEEFPLLSAMKLSEHQVGFQEVLALAKLRDSYPAYLHLVGVQPADITPGVELSVLVQAALPEVTRRTANILHLWLN